MIFGKIDRYLLIAILIVGLIALYFLFTNKKETGDQSNLLLAMAQKLGSVHSPQEAQLEKELVEKIEERYKPTEEEEDQITNIADKICFSKDLSQEEEQFKQQFGQEIASELEISRKVVEILINKFLTGVKEFDDFEKEFYEANKDDIDQIVTSRMILDSIIKKLVAGNTDFTEIELEYRENYAQYIEQQLSRIKKSTPSFKGANPPSAADDRLKLILSFFDDGKAKSITDLAKLYAEAMGTKPHTGNASMIFGKLVDDGKLKCTRKKDSTGRIYHGLPGWFEKDNLKPEHKPIILA